jgi:16S rRNA C967 or C1407 C5-methylase (RsmB/RsmF family)
VTSFDEYYAQIYQERWPVLKAALVAETKQVARLNAFISEDLKAKYQGESFCEFLPNSFWAKGHSPERSADDLLDFYVLDPASVLVAQALGVQAGDRVLDMCAAPGGKTLVLFEALAGEGELIANDLSPDRRERLKKVIHQYVPREQRNHLWIKGQDAVQFGLKDPGSFDRILLDAPCSGEKHLLENEKAFQEWSPRRSEHLAVRQYSLLASALLALKPGGRLVYSTCTLSPQENDGVIGKLLKKKKQKVKLIQMEPPIPGAEKTEFGVSFLPDQLGFGPLYFSVLEKSLV